MYFSVVAALLLCLQTAFALRFNIDAKPNGNTRCIRDFVSKGTLVTVKARSNGYVGDGQKLSVTIKDSKENRYGYKDNVGESYKQVFTPSQDASFDVCFTNTLQPGRNGPLSREIDLDVEIGANARDWNALQAAEKLKPVEVDLRRVDEITEEMQKELEYLRLREERLRNTNESTNRRVKNFFVLIIIAFVALGAWQIHYLRTYFRSKHII